MGTTLPIVPSLQAQYFRKFLVFYRCRQCKERFEKAVHRHHGSHEAVDVLTEANVTMIHNCRFGDLGVGDLTGVREVAIEANYEGGTRG